MTTPTEIRLKQRDRTLDVVFDSGLSCSFPCAFLRAFTPSADENRRPLAEKLASLKQHCQVNISDIEQVGHYAVKLRFDDGHETGLYSWNLLHRLALEYQEYTQADAASNNGPSIPD